MAHILAPAAGEVPPVFDASIHEASASGDVGGKSNASRVETWAQRQLRFYVDSYSTFEAISASLVTFNVGCKKPPSDLSFVLGKGIKSPRDPNAPDIVVVALQEVDMSASALLMVETEAAVPWVNGLVQALGVAAEHAPYRMLAQRQLVGLMLLVFARYEKATNISNVKVGTIATGAIGGTMANKGAIGLRLEYKLSSVCFICCHLAAHQNAVAKRNQDIQQIFSALNMAPDPQPGAIAPTVLLPTQHDVCIVLGDLNYRVDNTYEGVLDLIKQGDLRTLLKDDQLHKELKQVHSPWKGFTDLTPTFNPTYRFDIGTSVYDTSEKKRIPSWTDRVLWKAAPDHVKGMGVLNLDSVPSCESSDHKPVVASMTIPVRAENSDLKAQMVEKLRGVVAENGLSRVASAQVQIDRETIDFGTCSYLAAADTEITLSNPGLCVSEVRLVRRVVDDTSDGMYLRVSPGSVNILPGKTATVTVRAVFDWAALRWTVNEAPFQGRKSIPLESFLMAVVHDGPARVVDVRCCVELGAFGNTLDNLAACGPLPVTQAYTMTPREAPSIAPDVPHVAKELWFLVDALSKTDVAGTPDLFDGTPDAANVLKVMQHLSTQCAPIDREALSVAPDDIAAALLLFLRDLQLAVVPPTHHAAAIAAGKAQHPQGIMAVLRELPVNHYNTLVYLVSFLRFLLRPQHAAKSGATADDLATAFAPVIFALSPHARPQLTAAQPEEGSPSTGAAAATQGSSMDRRAEYEAELNGAVRFVKALVGSRPEIVA